MTVGMVQRPQPGVFRTRHFLIALAVFILDQISKGLVQGLPRRESVDVIPNLFRIVHVENSGAAFGLFQNADSPLKNALLIAFSLAALIVVFALLWKNAQSRLSGLALALIFGGACGNLFDRLLRGSVVDFLLFYIGPHEWPTFNLADSAIVIGAGLLVWEILHGERAAAALPALAEAEPGGEVGSRES